MASKTLIKVEPATEVHVQLLAEGMSPIVREELGKLYPDMSLEDMLRKAFDLSDQALAAYYKGDFVAVMGVTSVSKLSDVGHPWLLPHKNLEKYKYAFFPATKRWVKHLLSEYKVLENRVYTDNKKAIKWLKWLGFTVGDPVEIGGTQFCPYRIERKSE